MYKLSIENFLLFSFNLFQIKNFVKIRKKFILQFLFKYLFGFIFRNQELIF